MRRWLVVVVGALLAAGSGTAAPAEAASIQTTWYSGSMAPGATKTFSWNNANPLNAAYFVGLSPTGAGTTATCQFEVTRTWYLQRINPGGSPEREFWFTIKNVGTITCGADVLLTSISTTTTWFSGSLAAGASQYFHWNNATPLNTTYVVGLSPLFAGTTTTCQMEVTRTWYVQQPGGEREFHFIVKNVGSIACAANIYLAKKTTSTTWGTGALAMGASTTTHWNNAIPLNAAYVVGLSPTGATSTTPCHLEVTRDWYLQRINSNGNPEREYYLTVTNVGSLTCSASIYLAATLA